VKEPLEPLDPLSEIENRLQKLTPAQLPSGLGSRLKSADPSARKITGQPWIWLSLAAAASIAIAAAWIVRSHRANSAPDLAAQPSLLTPDEIRIYTPISSRNLLLDAREIGVIQPHNSPPVRLVHCLWIDDSTYRADQGNDHLEVTQAREQIIPVALEIY